MNAGSGSGTVTSSPSGIDCGADCSETFEEGTVVTLTAIPDAGSTFTGWIGGGCSGTGDCTVTMNADTDVTATLDTCSNLPACSVSGCYYSIQEAYDNANSGDTIQSQAARFIGDLDADRNISVTMEGGYDCDYLNIIGNSILKGNMTISDGTVIIENFEMEN